MDRDSKLSVSEAFGLPLKVYQHSVTNLDRLSNALHGPTRGAPSEALHMAHMEGTACAR